MNPKLIVTYTPPPAFSSLLEEVRTRTKAAAAESADHTVREAQARVAVRTGGTLRGIHKEETHDGAGYVVLVTRDPLRNLPYWLEYGTVHMTPKPFLWAAVALEAGPHEARMADAVRDGLTAAGYGA
jgi:hypothetical protein